MKFNKSEWMDGVVCVGVVIVVVTQRKDAGEDERRGSDS